MPFGLESAREEAKWSLCIGVSVAFNHDFAHYNRPESLRKHEDASLLERNKSDTIAEPEENELHKEIDDEKRL